MNDTHERIITAARELFEEQGFAAATTKEIADRAGVSEVTLFRHFENKRKLFEETVHSCLHPYLLDEYLSGEAAYDFEVDLKRIAFGLMEMYEKNAPLIRILLRDKHRDSAPEMDFKKREHRHETKLREYFAEMKKRGKTSADPDMAVTFYISNIGGYMMRHIFSGSPSNEEYFKWMLEKVINVLKS